VSGVPTTVKPETPKASPAQRATIIAFAAILVGVAVWGLTACNRDGDPSAATTTEVMDSGQAKVVPAAELGTLPSEVGHAIYWAGPQAGERVEFSKDTTGNVHLRYLTDGAEVGDPSQTYLNIGSYPFAGAYAATKKLANGPGVVKVNVNDGVGFYDPQNPFSVILAWPGEPDLQVEVYDPVKNRALDIVRSGDIVPVS